MNEPWSIQLFGGLRVRQSERLITRFRTQKTGALLAFLAYHRQHSHGREVLIEMFWPDTTPESGRHNLSHALSSLRNQLEPPGVPAGAVIIADRFSVELNPDAYTTDVTDFDQALRTATQARNTPEQMPLLIQAVAKYKGPLLPDYYEDWIAPAQERLAQRFQQAAAQLIVLLEKAGNLEAAIELAQRTVALDPLREEAVRELMRLLSATGQIEAALRQYREYERVLDQELGEEPGSALSEMVLEIDLQLAQNRPSLDVRAVATMATPLPPASAQIALPTGTVTVLMTDVEGSTALWEKAGDAFRSALSTHHALMRREFRRNGGQEVKEAGDSFLVVFAGVADALACAIACQRSLDTQPWPALQGVDGSRLMVDGRAQDHQPSTISYQLKVRMALHTGDVELEEGEYHGLMLHRAARMLSAAHGGQILCSEATTGLLIRDLDSQVHLKDLGVWRLRDVEEPERLFQAVYPQMAIRESPPLNASPAHRAHLPLQFTRFFGREEEIARLVEVCGGMEVLEHGSIDGQTSTPPHSHTRLITLTGPAGTGKTRLCIEAAGRFSETFAGAIWFVPLADLSDPGLIPQTILQAMSIPLTGSQEPLEQLVTALTNQSTLLLLDNFEQLVAGGAEVLQTLLSRVPTLQCMVTSRQTLSLPGEVEFAVTPLPTPSGSPEHPNTQTPERLTMFESVRLFVDRAQAAKPDFRITNSNAPAVAELCDRLEGMPLAIELAAARALVLTPSQMLVQLGSRFEFLVSRKRGIVERQRTLRAAVDWSYRLLSPDLQRFFAQLCVFRGGWTLEAAEAACDEPLALDMLAQLRECSLVFTQDSESGIRLRMLESLREFAKERLSAEESTSVRGRHAEFFLALAEESEPQLRGPQQVAWLNRLETEHDNLRTALAWYKAQETGAEAGLRLAGALGLFWDMRGHWREGREHLKEALARDAASGQPPARAKALHSAAKLAWMQSDFVALQACHEESLSLWQEIGDRRGIASSLNGLGHAARRQGAYGAAQSLVEESLAISRELGDRWGIADSLNDLGDMVESQGDYVSARALFEESLAIWRELGDKTCIAYSLHDLGNLADNQDDYASARALFEQGLTIMRELGSKGGIASLLAGLGRVAEHEEDFALARSLYEESLAITRELGNKNRVAWILHGLVFVAYRQGDFATARSLLVESLGMLREMQDKDGLVYSLDRFGGLAVAQGRMERAARLLEAAASLREAMGAPLPPSAQREYNLDMEAACAALGEQAFASVCEVGRTMTLEQAVAYALEEGA